ncbi:MAG: RHS repeat-associated core domain-containing protein, partial [Neisseria sp.]|nr:RHS repeat-associated core domain-containing protein [Neisseria sp.]
YLYYGSGHLHQISLDDEVIADIERDQLHREIYRTQGKLASRYELDPLGRLKRQIATLNELTEGGKGKTKVAAGYGQTAVKRSYGYDRTGNLTHSTDQRTGTTHFAYDKLGRITKAGSELFAFDPAHNILDIPTEKVKPYPAPSPVGEGRREGKTTAPLSDGRAAITDNRLKTYNGTTYYYDDLGNLIHRELADGEVQNYFYDLHDQLVKAEIFKKDGTKETWTYSYDALGRRIGKGRLKNGEVSGSLEDATRFVWDGSHLLQEQNSDGRYTYIYTDPDSYEPLAQVRDWTTEDGENRQQTNYFHCDQIGIPREMTDKDGNLLWFGNYTGWGRLKEETRVTDSAYQPFRLQNQYADRETGLHYNFFRYYEPDAGRFVNQDPIGLMGGVNFYQFAPNTQSWIDPSGNIAFIPILIAMGVGALSGAATDAGMQVASNVINGKEWNDIDYGSVALGAGIGAITGPVLGKAAKLCVGKCQAKNFFKGTRYTEKVKKQASSGDYHSFPEAVDSFSRYGKVSKIKGGDGITRQKLEIPGGYKGKEGVFEYIKEPNGKINHRLFKPNK